MKDEVEREAAETVAGREVLRLIKEKRRAEIAKTTYYAWRMALVLAAAPAVGIGFVEMIRAMCWVAGATLRPDGEGMVFSILVGALAGLISAAVAGINLNWGYRP